MHNIADPESLAVRQMDIATLLEAGNGAFILVQRRFAGPGVSKDTFGFRWFLPSLFRYRKAFGHVLVASLFVQIFALVTPLFQVVVDKVLAHRSYSTLIVLVIGLVALGLFDVILQYLRTYALSHTTNRIDVELGQRLFRHMMNLPLSYFETRAAGQTVARIRELETIRDFDGAGTVLRSRSALHGCLHIRSVLLFDDVGMDRGCLDTVLHWGWLSDPAIS